MKSLARNVSKQEPIDQTSMTVETTLYELIEAIQKRLLSDDDKQVVRALARVLSKSRIRFPGETKGRKIDVKI